MKMFGRTLRSQTINFCFLGYLVLGILTTVFWNTYIQFAQRVQVESRERLSGLHRSQMDTKTRETVDKIHDLHDKADVPIAELDKIGKKAAERSPVEFIVLTLLDLGLIIAFFMRSELGFRLVLAKSITLIFIWLLNSSSYDPLSILKTSGALLLFTAVFGWWTKSRHFLEPKMNENFTS